ncbi:ABC transporter ATP-binding protein [Bradyrhizobium sp. 200]|uniref:ABC transporter ATP-binding protein n=1 Tax=Bradyrhizobium sp. 200 TaxID=2782665 RepID=UPI001FFF2BF4|nr:ABC transporter ATP-binding protein [Bradyrhizobium sp. 200]UPJ48422.1 ABC transporter ATP-binding protein [Bradyrhizobium sp. 200]
MKPMLAAEDIHVRYGGSIALEKVSISIPPGRMIAVAGPNGAGKSTLVNALAGWSRGSPRVTGSVVLDGFSILGQQPHRIANLGLQHVPEGKNVFAELTVTETLALVREPLDKEGRHLYSREQVLSLFPRLHERRSHKGGQLSGGERQMLAVSRALLAGPKVLLLDEPSVGLAPRLIMELLIVIRRLVDDGLPVLLVEQNIRAALEVADELYLLERGRIVAHGEAASMRQHEMIVNAYLGGASH